MIFWVDGILLILFLLKGKNATFRHITLKQYNYIYSGINTKAKQRSI